MRFRPLHGFSAALAAGVFLAAAAQAQVIPFLGPGLSSGDNQFLFESVARLNAEQPSQVGQSQSWSNPRTKSSGTSTILKVFNSGGMPCHLISHQILTQGSTARNYRLTWCRTPDGEWKIKS